MLGAGSDGSLLADMKWQLNECDKQKVSYADFSHVKTFDASYLSTVYFVIEKYLWDQTCCLSNFVF